MSYVPINDLMWTVFEEIWLEDNNDFPQAITCLEDIRYKINIHKIIFQTNDPQIL